MGVPLRSCKSLSYLPGLLQSDLAGWHERAERQCRWQHTRSTGPSLGWRVSDGFIPGTSSCGGGCWDSMVVYSPTASQVCCPTIPGAAQPQRQQLGWLWGVLRVRVGRGGASRARKATKQWAIQGLDNTEGEERRGGSLMGSVRLQGVLGDALDKKGWVLGDRVSATEAPGGQRVHCQ